MSETVTIAGVAVSSPDKVLFAGTGTTKSELAHYYADVAEVMLPHLAGRPISMQRFPDGIDASGFFEKKAPSYFPSTVHRIRVKTADGEQEQVVVDNRSTLVYLADQACITPHTWLSRDGTLNAPDQLVFDLDPSVPGIDAVRRAARVVGELLDDLGLPAYLKTTGSRGYHVLTPLRGNDDFDRVRDFARQVAALLVDKEPDLLTIEQSKSERGDRVLIDVMRNAYAQTIAPPYAVRARRGAPVSTPLWWRELDRVAPDSCTMESARKRLSAHGDPWHDVRRHGHELRPAREKLTKLSG